MSDFLPVPPIPYWLWKRWLLLYDESNPLDLIDGMDYLGAGVYAQILGGSSYGTVTVSNYNDCVPPSYPDGVWFDITATKSISFPGAAYSDRVYIDNTWNVTFNTSHPSWYQWSSDRVNNYASGSCQGAGMYYYFQALATFNDSELCETSPNMRGAKYYLKVHGEQWVGGPPPAAGYSTYQSYGYDIIKAGCSTHTDGGVAQSRWRDKNWNNQMSILSPSIYPWHLKFFVLAHASGFSYLNIDASVYMKFTNYPQFHIPPEYQ